MSLFGSLYTGVNGMQAQTQSTAAISNNIANMTTTGYKKYDTVFLDLVSDMSQKTYFGGHGASTETVQRISQQGQLRQTGFSTDMGISGNGFFVVGDTTDPVDATLYTRNGSFSPDSEGILRNAAGFVLFGWSVDPTTGVVTQNLEAVDVDRLSSTFRPTTAATLAMNLDGGETAYNVPLPASSQSTWDPVNQVTIDTSEASHFTRTMTVYDNVGTPRQISFEFRKVIGPMANASSGASGLSYTAPITDLTGIAAGDTFTIDVGGTSQTYVAGAPPVGAQVRVDTIGDLTNHLNTQFGGGTIANAALGENGRLVLQALNLTDGITLAGGALTGGPGTLDFAAGPFLPTLPNPNSAVGVINPQQDDFPLIDVTNTNPNGWWEMRALKPADPALGNMSTAFGQPQEISKGLINFDSLGQFNTLRDPVTGAVLDGLLTLNSGNFDSNITGEDISFDVDISRMSQFSGGYNTLVTDQNGAEAGTFTNVEITREGLVVANYSNGDQTEVYQIPLATFVNPDGLVSENGTVFRQTADAGQLSIVAASTNGTGLIQAKTLENSNVDLGDEFSLMIVSQRAYSANSRVVSTVDEMTELLRTLKQ